MATCGSRFENFLNLHFEEISRNVHLTGALLMALKARRYIDADNYHELLNLNVHDRGLRFFEILIAQPADFESLIKTKALITCLESRNHHRPSVAEIFTQWVEGYSTKRWSEETSSEVSGRKDSSSEESSSDESSNWEEMNSEEQQRERLCSKIRETRISKKLGSGVLKWYFGENQIKNAEHILNLVDPFGGAEEIGTAKKPKYGKVLYLNWRFDIEGRCKTYNKLKLQTAVDEGLYAERFFEWLTCGGRPTIRKNISGKRNLKVAVQLFKDEITNWLEAEKTLDYILVVINCYGYKGQILTDGLQTAQLYKDIIRELDHPRINMLDENVPRLYLVNSHQFTNRELLSKFDEEPEIFHGNSCRSPFFILHSSLINTNGSNQNLEGTSVFFQAIMDEFKSGVNMFNMINQVLTKIDHYAHQRQQKFWLCITQSPTFKVNQFKFKPRSGSLKPSATSSFSANDAIGVSLGSCFVMWFTLFAALFMSESGTRSGNRNKNST